MKEILLDPNKVGHKYTNEYKQKVKDYFLTHNSNLTVTLRWVRQTYPKMARKIIHTWVDDNYASHIRKVRERNNQKWKERYPEKYAEVSKINQANQIKKYGAKRNEKTRIWRENNKEHLKEYHKHKWQLTKEKQLARKRERKKEDPVFRLLENTRTYIWQQLQKAFASAGKTFNKEQSTCELIGCTPDEYLNHLRSLYKPGMTDENYGEWHVDHIIPCSSFDLTKEEEKKKCFNYKNTQPLWKIDNLSKSNKIL